MSVLYPSETEYAKERVKWEATYSECGIGLRPYEYREFPKRLYKAGLPENGLGAYVIVEELEVGSEREETPYLARGFRDKPLAAIAYVEGQQLEHAKLAAELNYEQKNKLSEGASAEVEAARAEHVPMISRHMPVVPVTPIRKRGRKVTPKEN